MEDLKLYDAEYRLLEIVWEKEPLSSTELYKECLPRLGWKKSTTYTVLRKLVERKILKNENGAVTALVKKETVQRYESQAVVEKLTILCRALWQHSWERRSLAGKRLRN